MSDKLHAVLGASVADRWVNCSGSVNATRGLPNTSSVYAEEGTAAHELLEHCLVMGCRASDRLGTMIGAFEVTDNMADAVQVFLDTIEGLREEFSLTKETVEQSVRLDHIAPPGEDMFGTNDWHGEGKDHNDESVLVVADYKHGIGYAVDKETWQVKYYLMGARAASPLRPTRFIGIIVQPRAGHEEGAVRRIEFTAPEMDAFEETLRQKALNTQDPDAPLNPGKWCRFCPAAPTCPAKRDQAVALAKIEFSDPAPMLPAVERLSEAQMLEVLEKAPQVEQWFKSIRDEITRRLRAGEPVEGMKLVAKRATRKWTDPKEAVKWLKEEGYEPEEIAELKLRSPAQIEKLVGKKGFRGDLTEKKSSGTNLVPVSDPRPAVTQGDEFFSITDGDDYE